MMRQLTILTKYSALLAFTALFTGLVYLSSTQSTYKVHAPSETTAPTGLSRVLGHSASDFFSESIAMALCSAIDADDRNSFERLVNSDCINQSGVAGMTPLMWAYTNRRYEMYEGLLLKGADPDAKLKETTNFRHFTLSEGDSVLFMSLKSRQFDYFLAALKFSSNVQQRDAEGWTFLHYILGPSGLASGSVDQIVVEVITHLLSNGLDVNAGGPGGMTALHVATAWQPAYCVVLLENGADPTVRNDAGDSALDLWMRERTERKAAQLKPALDWLRAQGRLHEPPVTRPQMQTAPLAPVKS